MPTSPSSESIAVMKILGADAWARFDVWSTRAFDASEKAAALAADLGPVMGTNADLDPRIVTLFHAAGVAERLSSMTNPLFAVAGTANARNLDSDGTADIDLDMLLDSEDD